ncbi:uncharacterized protein GGS25DRAFT_528752 [Hypoxylon fragiforme]|uniref:uncharacterized protein n=1 Tax=Hypoxylon fragiforme TaxID=63214 RepID=UPI0020C5B914|nr:uncharacterized protein GGS25DRAFT_528752 [Hypoxylon fragiforme]KAI2612005.1 hypothetical protein GGS25DRAFT_528752 [Hypoxylon fragiforme]
MGFINAKYFNARYKLPVHIAEILLVLVVIILTVVRLAMGNTQRVHIMGIAFGIKSLIFVLYQLLTEHTQKFQKWASAKTNFILNCVDHPFWAALMGMLFMANLKSCSGTSCGVSWAMTALAMPLSLMSLWLAVTTYFEYRAARPKTLQDTSYSSC